MFDSWRLEYLVTGHSQDGAFFTPDTMVSVRDTVLGIDQSLYLTATRKTRDAKGTRTLLTLRKPLLGA
jgi:prophage tail gpP-like protein